MSLRRRLLLFVLIGAPIVWLTALGYGLWRARHEINELFDTQQVRLAQQVLAVLPENVQPANGPRTVPGATVLPAGSAAGESELEDMAIAVWDREGRLMIADREGAQLPFRSDVAGFIERGENDARWRIYYLNAPDTRAIVAVGQRLGERDELIYDLLLGQLAPWLLMLALLLLVLSVGVRRGLQPVVTLARSIETRPSADLRPLPLAGLPSELAPLVTSINRLFNRIQASIEHDRRFTADAAHELRTPLAATRAQWDVAATADDPAVRAQAARNVSLGLDRMSGLVSQLLALARLDAVNVTTFEQRIDWNEVVARALSEVLALADERQVEIDVAWSTEPAAALPLMGSTDLITAALRNLVDNAVRYSPAGSTVTIRCDTDSIAVVDSGPGVAPDSLPRLGDRFFRAAGQETVGSGLGLSIVGRIARLHGLALGLANRAEGGFCSRLVRAG